MWKCFHSKNPIIIPTSNSQGPGHMLLFRIPKVYLLLYSAITPIAIWRRIYSFLPPLRRDHQQGSGVQILQLSSREECQVVRHFLRLLHKCAWGQCQYCLTRVEWNCFRHTIFLELCRSDLIDLLCLDLKSCLSSLIVWVRIFTVLSKIICLKRWPSLCYCGEFGTW